MHIGTLSGLPFATVVGAFLRAFEGYFVPLPTDPDYWEDRFRCAGVNWSLSYGAFDDDELVAFIIHGVGNVHGKLVACNGGTGVLPHYRGRQLVDALYAHALPYLREAGVSACSLEVIEANAAARRVYERIGFHVDHCWKVFKGRLKVPNAEGTAHTLVPADLYTTDLGDDRWYSWDNRVEALRRSSGRQQLYTLGPDMRAGHVVIAPSTGRIARMSVADEQDVDQWIALLTAIAALKADVAIVNVHPERLSLLAALAAAGLENTVDQFEMRMAIPAR
jgi:GNAT superfamily N-acetyltransferase